MGGPNENADEQSEQHQRPNSEQTVDIEVAKIVFSTPALHQNTSDQISADHKKQNDAVISIASESLGYPNSQTRPVAYQHPQYRQASEFIQTWNL